MDGQYRTAHEDPSNKDDPRNARSSPHGKIVWLLKVEDPSHVWVKEPFSPTILRVALAAPLGRDDLTYCLTHTGIISKVQAELDGTLGEWRDGAFTLQGAEYGRPGMTIRRNSTCVAAASDGFDAAEGDGAGGATRIPTTKRKRRGFGRTME